MVLHHNDFAFLRPRDSIDSVQSLGLRVDSELQSIVDSCGTNYSDYEANLAKEGFKYLPSGISYEQAYCATDLVKLSIAAKLNEMQGREPVADAIDAISSVVLLGQKAWNMYGDSLVEYLEGKRFQLDANIDNDYLISSVVKPLLEVDDKKFWQKALTIAVIAAEVDQKVVSIDPNYLLSNLSKNSSV